MASRAVNGSPPRIKSEIVKNITNALRDTGHDSWTGNRNYEVMSKERMFRQFDDVHRAIVTNNPGANIDELDRALIHSRMFAECAFRSYEMTDGELLGGRFDSVFSVPLRADGVDPIYASDTDAFMPILGRRYGVSPEIQLRGALGLPPSIIETNLQDPSKGARGATIFVPLYGTMRYDYRTNPDQLLRVGAEIMHKATELAHVRLGAKVLGLGGIFPKLSAFGAVFKHHPKYDTRELVTTTGHGGTVFLILETIKKLQETKTIKNSDMRLGVIGAAGSIGWSTIESIFDLVGEFEMYSHDFRSSALNEKISDFSGRVNSTINQESTALDVMRKSDIIVSAVTRPIDLDAEDPCMELNLEGKVIIDDSEPKAFRQEQVEKRGGYMVNVVGKDTGDFKALRRDGLWTGGSDNPYKFGEEAGIYDGASWGCDVERVIISTSGEYDEALTADVTSDNVRSIGKLCLRAGLTAASFQVNSQPVFIP